MPYPGILRSMRRLKKDPMREDRIHEVVADANGREEQVMGWHYYLDDKIRLRYINETRLKPI